MKEQPDHNDENENNVAFAKDRWRSDENRSDYTGRTGTGLCFEEKTGGSQKAKAECPNCIFFAAKVVPSKENWFTKQLHNDVAFLLHRNLYLSGMQMVMIPVVLH